MWGAGTVAHHILKRQYGTPMPKSTARCPRDNLLRQNRSAPLPKRRRPRDNLGCRKGMKHIPLEAVKSQADLDETTS
eukprot:3543929-Pyramimonas_sp.AAC.1